VQQVSYTGAGYTCTSDSINRSASGIVTEWRPSGSCNGDASGANTLLFKPTSAAKPASCDSNYRGASFVLPYGPGGFGPYLVTSGYSAGTTTGFWTLGQQYLVCFYPLNHATGNFDWTAYTTTLRHVTFDVYGAGYSIPAGGTFSYSDADGNSYTVSPTCVSIDPTTGTIFFGGPVSNPSNPAWSTLFLYAKATTSGQYWGSFVNSDPCPALGQTDPTDGPFAATGISITPILGS
jgi:hypothetical protein